MASTTPKAEEISRKDFDALLAQYATIFEATSKSKTKAGTSSRKAEADTDRKTLAELDEYRYVTAPSIFGPEARIGPATASLVLSVHDARACIFFSDEAFRWLCRDGDGGAAIRYTAAEYGALCEAAASVVRRIDVGAVEVEKVAYVVMRSEGHDMSGRDSSAKARREPSPVVEVLDVEDLSLSRWEQAEALREVARGERTSGRQIVRLDESAEAGVADEDCRGTRVYAVELRRLPRIGVRSTAMGEKILLRAGTVVARGTVLLAPESCLLLGGRIDAWHDAWANSRLQRLEEIANN
ncbi:hypothetical protein CP533_6324 [Ophiocordyceps camponoti-saundersi (nom. inval.)]|nr:hypothetical protein CP533_6324 [Ophiocordyceps camponoti-saundersi (nom. inval.)]